MKIFIAGMGMLLGVACALTGDKAVPVWTAPANITEKASPVLLSGRWVLNRAFSDDPRKIMQAAAKRQQRILRGPDVVVDDGRIKVVDAPLFSNRNRDSDPRLKVLFTEALTITQNEDRVMAAFDDGTRMIYLANGQATSSDHNLNITLADWEGSQLIVEKNGPRGRVLERWILSPDGSQLYLYIGFEMLVGEPVIIGRMFDRQTTQNINDMP